MKWCEKSRSLLYLLYQGKPETGTNSQLVLLEKNYLPTRNQSPPIATIGCSTSNSISVVHKRHSVFWERYLCSAQELGRDQAQCGDKQLQCQCEWRYNSQGYREPAAIRAACLPVYEKHKVWYLLLAAYFSGFVFALLSLLPLKSLPHQVQRKQSRERVLLFSAPMPKQQQQLIGAMVWWPQILLQQ